YEPQIAPYEDSSIKMWFEHSFKKIMTSDTTPSDMDTYTVYMGKNEIENAQFVLYSDETHEKMRASIGKFKDANGNTVDAELFYQMYINIFDLNSLAYPGATEENTFLREGEQPDPVTSLSNIGRFQLNGGKSQAFYIRLKTTDTTASGWYSSQLNIYNSSGQVVKTATVYAYVWDFTLSEKTDLKTSIYLKGNIGGYSDYKSRYDYLLENRIVAMDIPGELNSSNPYLTNDRVNAIRVTSNGGGNNGNYMDFTLDGYDVYGDIYTDLSSLAEWEAIKDKFYFYTIDEAVSQETGGNKNINHVILYSEELDMFWPNASKVVPYHENHAYPYFYYNDKISNLDPGTIKDGTQAMIDTASMTLWCPQYYAFTPLSELDKYGYDAAVANWPVRSLSGGISGNSRYGEAYFNWERVFGEFRDRIISNNIIRNEDPDNRDELWTYSAGWNNGYTYCNHLIENTGLQTKMLFWQLYRMDVTGYLYYGANFWTEYDKVNGEYVDTTVTGNRLNNWKTNLNKTYAAGHSVHGNGVLLYDADQGGISKIDYVGSVRVEHMRDGIEEYQMFKMLESLKGDKASDDIIDAVSVNVVNYLSMPDFDRSAFDSSLDDYDVLALQRIELGNQLEAASRQSCNHDYDDGKVTKEATCLELGEITYTCTICGAGNIEYIPAKHTSGASYTEISYKAAECTSPGERQLKCADCGYIKYETIPAHHENKEMFVYSEDSKYIGSHEIFCSVCEASVGSETHSMITQYTNTCTEAGEMIKVCYHCPKTEVISTVEAHGHYMIETYEAPTCTEAGYSGGKCYNCGHEEGETIAALGHKYVDGKCENCGEADPDASQVEMGDIDGNGNINSVDLFKMNLYVKQVVAPTEAEEAAADIDENGKVNSVDMFYLKFRILKGYWG
ncbi:MAG: DUF4091 domain-containing protein, partial [Clostridia bacterium]|nr:DUF4091 domain-containing protein [Clostridia bacterium]